MKCLDNIYTKQIKYNSPVLYQLESLKKEYEKLLKVSNEIIKTGSFIEECYFENQSAVLSDNEITFSGNLKIKTDAGNYFQNIPSSLKLNVQGTGEIVVDVGEDNKTLIFKLDEEFLSEISLMIEDLDSLKEKVNSQVFDNFIGIRNTTDSKIDQIKHINNNFQITSSDGKSLLNIDEQLEKISSFNKNILTSDDLKMLEQIETIYDMTSDDININKGLTSGMGTGEYAIDLRKYKKIIITTKEGFRSTNYVMNLYNKTIDDNTKYLYNTCYGFLSEQNINYIYNLYSIVNEEKTTFIITLQRFNLSNNTSKTDLGVVTKIEGVF